MPPRAWLHSFVVIRAALGLVQPTSVTLKQGTLLSLPPARLASLTGSDDGMRYLWRLMRQGRCPFDVWESSDAEISLARRFRISPDVQQELVKTLLPLKSVAELSLIRVAADGTRKLLIKLSDELEVEAVLIPPLPSGDRRAANARSHTTLCISSQVGCRMACAFCATGRMGLVRNLSADEILAQAFLARRVVEESGLPR